MKATLTLIGAALVLAACAPAARSAGPSSAPAVSPSPVPAVTPSTSPTDSPSLAPITGKCAYPSADIPDKVMVRDVFREGTGVTETCVDRRAEEPGSACRGGAGCPGGACAERPGVQSAPPEVQSASRQECSQAFFEYLPDPCGRDLGVKTSSIVARRAVEVTFDDDPSNDDAQASMYRHTVTVYNSPDAASAYLSSVRAAVRECPTRDLQSQTWKYAIISSTAQRLELSVRHIANHPLEGGEPQEATFRVSVFRSGARVSVVADVGWEGYPSTKLAVDALVKAAAEQLDRWE